MADWRDVPISDIAYNHETGQTQPKPSISPVVRVYIEQGSKPVRVECDRSVTVEIFLTCVSKPRNLGVCGHGRDATTTERAMLQEDRSQERVASGPAWIDTISEWQESRRRQGLNPDWIAKVTKSLDRLRAFTGADRVCDLDRRAFEDFFGKLQDGEITGRSLAPKTANNYLSGFNAFFQWCIRHEHVPASWASPSDTSEWTKGEHNQRRALRLEEALAIFAAAVEDESREEPRTRNAQGEVVYRSGMYWTLMCTGIRIGAAEKLRRRHFLLDSEPPMIHVPSFNGGKGKKPLQIPVSKNDADVLNAYFDRLPAPLDPHDLALTRPHHRVLARDARNAGIPERDEYDRPIGFHSFRRFHATELFRMGANAGVVQKRMNHASLVTTLKHYNDVVREDQERVASEFGERLAQKKQPILLTRGGEMTDTRSDRPQNSDSNPFTINESSSGDPDRVDGQSTPGSPATRYLPRPEIGKRIGIGARGFEPLATDSAPNRGEALALIARWTEILESLIDDRR